MKFMKIVYLYNLLNLSNCLCVLKVTRKNIFVCQSVARLLFDMCIVTCATCFGH